MCKYIIQRRKTMESKVYTVDMSTSKTKHLRRQLTKSQEINRHLKILCFLMAAVLIALTALFAWFIQIMTARTTFARRFIINIKFFTAVWTFFYFHNLFPPITLVNYSLRIFLILLLESVYIYSCCSIFRTYQSTQYY